MKIENNCIYTFAKLLRILCKNEGEKRDPRHGPIIGRQNPSPIYRSQEVWVSAGSYHSRWTKCEVENQETNVALPAVSVQISSGCIVIWMEHRYLSHCELRMFLMPSGMFLIRDASISARTERRSVSETRRSRVCTTQTYWMPFQRLRLYAVDPVHMRTSNGSRGDVERGILGEPSGSMTDAWHFREEYGKSFVATSAVCLGNR